MIKVVCGIIYKNDKVFICRRKLSKSLGGFWEFPGGKIEPDETAEDSLKRELMEELQMEVDIIEYFDSSKHDYPNFSIELLAYKCTLKSWDSVLTDHDRYEWVSPSKITKFQLAPADIPLAVKLVEA